MKDNLVSIIMPSWNTAKFIGESIKSVLAQTYSDWELIIVDDCSTDNTDDVVSAFSDERIKYYKNDVNIGAALTRNRALREADGEWIAFLDSDDLWQPTKLEKMVAFMRDNNYAFAYHDYVRIDEEGLPLNMYISGPNVITKAGMYRCGYPGCLAFMYSAKIFGCVQIKDIKKNNDYAILLILCKKAKCYRLPENLAWYRIRKKSISHDNFLKRVRSHYDLFRYCDGQNPLVAFWYASWNMFFWVFKKLMYEKKI